MTTVTEDNNPIYIYTNEATSWPTGTTVTLMTYADGPGVVEGIQFMDTGKNFNASLNIQIDGGTVQTCSGPTFFGLALDPVTSYWVTSVVNGSFNYNFDMNIVGGINNKNYSSTVDTNWWCSKRVFIPFTRSIIISVNGNLNAAAVSSQVTYRKWPSSFPLYYSIGERRKYWFVSQHGTWTDPITLSAFSTTTTPQITGRGQIEFITHVLYGVTRKNASDGGCQPITCLAGEYTMTIDGNTQTYGSSEQFWGGNYYWNRGTGNGTYGGTVTNGPDCGLFSWIGYSWQGEFNMHAYRFCYDKPIFFNSSFTLGWTYGNSTRSVFSQGINDCSNLFLISYWLESTD